MKPTKTIYIASFTLLGILLNFLVHGAIELPYTTLLLKNFEKWGMGLPWSTWFWIHHIGTVVLIIAGALFGFWQGRYWWQRIYEQSAKSARS